MNATMLNELRKPFHPSHITWKPGAVKGERALAMPYADLRAYMNRLDEVCGDEWGVTYEPWGEERIICRLTIGGVTRSSTGESNKESERNEIGGTVAEAQAFKRAAAMFGLGRYLYNLPNGWADYDPATKKFTDKAKAKLTSILVQHYRHATDGSNSELADIFAKEESTIPENADGDTLFNTETLKLIDRLDALGMELYGEKWPNVKRRNTERISGGEVSDSTKLAATQVQTLIDGMMKLKADKLVQATPKG